MHGAGQIEVSVHSVYNEEQSQFASVYTFKMYQI